MKHNLFNLTMKVKSAHSAALQALGFSKHFIRDHSPLHKLLTTIAFKLAQGMNSPT